jgi:hypothetical protein
MNHVPSLRLVNIWPLSKSSESTPKNIVILQNKMDLVRESEAVEHCESIKKFVEGESGSGT